METTGRKPPQAFERQMPPVKVGAARGLRSPDLQFKKLPLCRAELWRHLRDRCGTGGKAEDPLQPAELRSRERKEKLPRHKDSEDIRSPRTTFKRDPTIARC